MDDTIIPERKVLDLTSNKHGSTLSDILLSSSTSVLNGRFPDSFDNYTCIRNGKSVVDYFICPHTCLKHCKRFHIERFSSFIIRFNLQHLVSERAKIPDHSILIEKIETAQYIKLEIDRRYNDMCSIICKEMDTYHQIKCCSKTQRRNFKIRKPYWNNELTQLWKVRVEKENLFLKCTGSSDVMNLSWSTEILITK